MNPTTQVIKRFCCTLSSGQASARDVCMQRVFLRVLPPCDSKLKRCSCRCLISPRQARWVVGWRGLAFYCAQMPHAAMQLGRDSSVFQHEAPQPTTRRLEIFTRGRVSRPRTALAGPGDCSRVHACQVMQTGPDSHFGGTRAFFNICRN